LAVNSSKRERRQHFQNLMYFVVVYFQQNKKRRRQIEGRKCHAKTMPRNQACEGSLKPNM
jgi:hypothetical protein